MMGLYDNNLGYVKRAYAVEPEVPCSWENNAHAMWAKEVSVMYGSCIPLTLLHNIVSWFIFQSIFINVH